MHNSKKYKIHFLSVSIALKCSSAYIISTATANKVKVKFYDEDIPALENVRPSFLPLAAPN